MQNILNRYTQIFNLLVRRVAAFEEPFKKTADTRGYIDLFCKGVLLVEQKSRDNNLGRAHGQAFYYFPGIKDTDLSKFLLLSDFQTFILIDLKTREEVEISLASLPDQIEKFGIILGIQKKFFKDQDPVNIQAS